MRKYILLLRLVGQGVGVVDGIRKRACVDWSNVSVPPRCYQGVAITHMQHGHGEQRVTPSLLLLRLCPILSLQLEHSFTPGRGGREWGGCYQGWKQSLDYEKKNCKDQSRSSFWVAMEHFIKDPKYARLNWKGKGTASN